MVKTVAGGVVQLAHQFDLKHLDALAIDFHIAFRTWLPGMLASPSTSSYLTLAQAGQGAGCSLMSANDTSLTDPSPH